MGELLQPVQRGQGLGLQVVGSGDAGAADAVGLDVLPDPLVGVEFRGVAGQQDQPQPPVGGRDELLDGAGAVGGVAVDDEEDRPIGIAAVCRSR